MEGRRDGGTERRRDRATERRSDGETERFGRLLSATPSIRHSVSPSRGLSVSPSLSLSVALSLCLSLLSGVGCGSGFSSAPSNSSSITVPAARPVPAGADGSEQAIRFLEDRVKKDPDDFIALNKLTGYYLLRLRETGSATWL